MEKGKSSGVTLVQCGCGLEAGVIVDRVRGTSEIRAQAVCGCCGERGPVRFGATRTTAGIAAAVAWNERRSEEIRRRA